MLHRDYSKGIVAQVFDTGPVAPFYRHGYIIALHDPGLYCPYTVSLATVVLLDKYGSREVKQRHLPLKLRTDKRIWQGATWMTQIRVGKACEYNT